MARRIKLVVPAKSVTLSKRRIYVIRKKVNWKPIVTMAVKASRRSSRGLVMVWMEIDSWRVGEEAS